MLRQYGTVFKVFDDQDSGNICFGTDDGEKRYFIKFAGAPTAEYHGDRQAAVTRLKRTLPIYRDIQHQSLIRFIQAEEIGHGYAMVFEWAEGSCMARMYPEEHRAIMGLPVVKKIAIFHDITDFLQTVIHQGYVAIDFYDGSVMYDETTGKTTICDIDFFQKRPVVNSMGRMWGSSRFMSPEEYRLGAEIDEVTNVFTLGQMAFSLFTDSERDADRWPLSRESYQVLLQATEPDRASRYQTITAFQAAWERTISL